MRIKIQEDKPIRFLIDLANSPHVLFFYPIIRELKAQGHEVIVTAREFAQTVPLIKKLNIEATIIGRHQGKSIVRKSIGLITRSSLLYMFGLKHRPDVALSHNSNDLAVAAYLLRIPHIMFHDYEFATVAHWLNSRLVTRLVFPEPVNIKKLEKIYGVRGKFDNYPGLKEQVYLPYWNFDNGIRKEIGVSEDEIMAVVRTPADFALYHRFKNELFIECLEYLKRKRVKVVLLPRNRKQERELKLNYPQFLYPKTVIDGPSLIKATDIVLSAGGTINREAAVLGVPAYTVFAGKIGDVDRFLMSSGRLKQVRRPEDIEIKRNKEPKEPMLSSNLSDVIKKIFEVIYEVSK